MADFDINKALGTDFGRFPRYRIGGALVQGAKPLLFTIGSGNNLERLSEDEFVVDQREIDEATKTSLLNTPVISNLEFPSGNYNPLGQPDVLEPYEGLRIDTVLFTITQARNIITTPIIGRNGTIKEYIADGDFEITAECIITGETQEGTSQSSDDNQATGSQILSKIGIGDKYPERDVKRLIEICQVPSAIQVTSSFLDLFGIKEVVIQNYNFVQTRGGANQQVVTLKMLSDTPIELQ